MKSVAATRSMRWRSMRITAVDPISGAALSGDAGGRFHQAQVLRAYLAAASGAEVLADLGSKIPAYWLVAAPAAIRWLVRLPSRVALAPVACGPVRRILRLLLQQRYECVGILPQPARPLQHGRRCKRGRARAVKEIPEAPIDQCGQSAGTRHFARALPELMVANVQRDLRGSHTVSMSPAI